jgi:hypothetical protein
LSTALSGYVTNEKYGKSILGSWYLENLYIKFIYKQNSI